MSGVASFGMLLIRGIVGVVMVAHGSQKLFGWFGDGGMKPVVDMVEGFNLPGGIPAIYWAYAAAISEFGGGVLLILGFLTPVAAIAVTATMGVAIWKMHSEAFFLRNDGMEFALTLGVVALGILFTGPGRISLDAAIWRGRGEAKANGK